MTDVNPPRNRAERRAGARRTRKMAAMGSGAVLAIGAAGAVTTLAAPSPAGAAAPIVVTSLADGGAGSLRDAIEQANAAAGQDTITFQTGLSGTITLASDLPHITDALAVQGPGASIVSVDGADQFSIFNFYGVSSGAGFDEVSGLTVTHGLAHNGDSSGGGVVTRNTSADLTISDAVITQNTASNDGGGVQAFNASGIVAILGTTISDNTTTGGGGGAFYAIANSALDRQSERLDDHGEHRSVVGRRLLHARRQFGRRQHDDLWQQHGCQRARWGHPDG